MPQGSTDRPLLFNLFINNLVFFIQCSVLSNYADDNNLFLIEKDKEDKKSFLLLDFQVVNNWFYENFIMLNPGKIQYMCNWKNLDDMKCLTLISLLLKIAKK